MANTYSKHTEEIKNLYNSVKTTWPQQDEWHQHTRKMIESHLYSWLSTTPNSTILNAGSGGTIYSIPGTVTHLDIAANLIQHLPNHVVGSVEDMPFADESFDVVICVGSVLNYVPLFPALFELFRVLKPGGLLLLEFERSNSAELWFTKDYGKNCTYKTYFYNGQEHGLWLYSEKLIQGALETMGMVLKNAYRFHNVSSICNRFHCSMHRIIQATGLDSATQKMSYLSAHNCIFCFSKKVC